MLEGHGGKNEHEVFEARKKVRVSAILIVITQKV